MMAARKRLVVRANEALYLAKTARHDLAKTARHDLVRIWEPAKPKLVSA